MGGFVQLLQ